MGLVFWTETHKLDAVSIALGALYIILFVGAAVIYFVRIRGRIYRAFSFFLAYELGVLARAIYFATTPFVSTYVPFVLEFIMNTLPSFFLFSSYLFLLLVWGDLYMRSHDRGTFKVRKSDHSYTKRATTIVLIINLLMYSFLCIMYGFDIKELGMRLEEPHHSTAFEEVVLIAMSAFYGICTVSFFGYAYFIYKSRFSEQIIDDNMHARTDHQRLILRRVGIFGSLCMLSFCTRAVITGVQVKRSLPQTPAVVALYYIFLELFPLCMMVFVFLSAVPEKKREKSRVPEKLTITSPLITD